ncbi:MAG: hypothetical protein ACLGXA_20475 [Acidobacteriota bacterium]
MKNTSYEPEDGKMKADRALYGEHGEDGAHDGGGAAPLTMMESHGTKSGKMGPDDTGDGSGHWSKH